MRKKYLTYKKMYLMNMLVFIGISFEFIIRNDLFFGGVLIFTGIFNLFAFQQAPKRVSNITMLLNLFNSLISLTLAYNYIIINFHSLFYLWLILTLGFGFAASRQLYSIIRNNNYRRKQKERIS